MKTPFASEINSLQQHPPLLEQLAKEASVGLLAEEETIDMFSEEATICSMGQGGSEKWAISSI